MRSVRYSVSYFSVRSVSMARSLLLVGHCSTNAVLCDHRLQCLLTCCVKKASQHDMAEMNEAPSDFSPQRDLPRGFWDFYLPFHQRFTPQQQLVKQVRAKTLALSHQGQL